MKTLAKLSIFIALIPLVLLLLMHPFVQVSVDKQCLVLDKSDSVVAARKHSVSTIRELLCEFPSGERKAIVVDYVTSYDAQIGKVAMIHSKTTPSWYNIFAGVSLIINTVMLAALCLWVLWKLIAWGLK